MATVSIKDVAARAGVSLGTVSNVLNRPAAVRAASVAESSIARRAAARSYTDWRKLTASGW